jgi:hygromycin-B 7''-O-kinase
MTPSLPPNPTHAEYDALRPNSSLWLQAMTTICQRHNFPAEPLARFGDGTDGEYGTNIVYALGQRHIIKLYPPFWKGLHAAECSTLAHVSGKLSVTTPELLAQGDLDGWPYLIMTRLQGTPLNELWNTLDHPTRLALVLELADLLARLHALPTDTLTGLASTWPAEIEQRVAGCVARHREQGAPEHWLQQIPRFLALAAPLYPPNFHPAIVSGDTHQYHLFVQQYNGQYHLSGFFDFDDACLGFAEYDLAAAALLMLARNPALLRPFLLCYGYPTSALDVALSRRLLAYTLLHRYRPFNWVRADFGDPACTTLDELAQVIYALTP